MPKSFAPKGPPGPLPLPGLQLPGLGQKILVAVSGGLDSMVLLHTLKALAGKHRWKLAVAHFNHRLRGAASDKDEALVRKTAAMMKLPVFVRAADVKKIAATKKMSVEMAARQLRHEFLAQTARRERLTAVALAHHADDQVELFFLRLLRGAGGDGLGGMRWHSPSPVDSGIFLFRPVLEVPRVALEEFAHKHRIRYREDATNRSIDFLRNRIRHELLPLLRKHYQSGLNKTILRSMQIAAAESNLIAELARTWLSPQEFRRRTKLKGDVWSSFSEAGFEELPEAVQRHVLKLQIIDLGVTPDFELIEFIRRSPHKPVAVSAHISLSRDAKGLVSRCRPATQTFKDQNVTVKLNRPGDISFDGVDLKWRSGKSPKRPGKTQKLHAGLELFDADKVGDEIVLRHWRAGDRFRPIGLKSAVKLQDLFTNAKIPREMRHRLVVAEATGGVFWVQGLRISENYKLTAQSKRILTWNWRRGTKPDAPAFQPFNSSTCQG